METKTNLVKSSPPSTSSPSQTSSQFETRAKVNRTQDHLLFKIYVYILTITSTGSFGVYTVKVLGPLLRLCYSHYKVSFFIIMFFITLVIQFLKIFVLGTCTYLKWPRTQSTYFWALQCRCEGNLKLGKSTVHELYICIYVHDRPPGSTEASGHDLPGIFSRETPSFGAGGGS